MIIEVTKNSLVACDRCHGKGTVDSFSGGFTGGDMDEWYGDDWDSRDEFVESYSRGTYDKACPVCNGNKVVSIFVNVVLPAPFGPRSPTNSPSFTVRDMLSRAVISFPLLL